MPSVNILKAFLEGGFQMVEADGHEDQKGYYRLVLVDYRAFERWLNLPQGFIVEDICEVPEEWGLILRIRCPEEECYEVKAGCRIPKVMGRSMTFLAKDGRRQEVKYWPEFFQLDPLDPFTENQ